MYHRTIVSRVVATLVSSVAVLALVGCSLIPESGNSASPTNCVSPSDTPSPTSSSSPTESQGPCNSATPTPTPTPVYELAPLTGELFLEGANKYLSGPVVMGKVDNSFAARPQGGLSLTDVVYEEMVEGGITRYLAIWHSQMPKQFGPIRSVRPMDPDIATPYGGVIAYSGGQKPFVQAMRATGLYNASETSEVGRNTMKRVKNRVAPHNLFVLAQTLARKERHLKPPKQQLQFAPEIVASAEPTPTTTAGASPSASSEPSPTATASASPVPTKSYDPTINSALNGKRVRKITAKFPQTTAVWGWDSKTRKWLRTQDGKKTFDASNKRRISADNVFVILVKVDRSIKDPRYGNIPKTIFEGKGKGMYFSEGHGIKVTWSKKSMKSAAVFKDGKGNVIKVAVGNTWFEMVPINEGSYSYR